MTMSFADDHILAISFYKDNTEGFLNEFERFLIYGVNQTLSFFTNLTFQDYAVPSERQLSLPQGLSPQEKQSHLSHLGNRLDCRYVVYGSLIQSYNADQCVEGITVYLNLFDCQIGQSLLQLSYPFNAFTIDVHSPIPFTLDWEGFCDLLLWMNTHLVGAIHPQQASAIWHKVSLDNFAESIEQFKKLVDSHYLQRDSATNEKIVHLESLSHETPHLFLAYLELGHLYKETQHYELATKSLEKAFNAMAQVTPHRRALCATDLGVCYALLQNHEQACHWWKAAISVYPMLLHPYLNLGHALENQGVFEEAEYYFRQASEIAPHDSRACYNLARLYSKLEAWEKAIEQYERQLIFEPNNPWIHSDVANCYLQQGNILRGKEHLLKTMELDPEGEAGRCAQFIVEGLHAAEV